MSDSEALTQAEVDALPVGTEVMVTWSGGNGPHRYRIARDQFGVTRADNIYRDPINRVGRHPLTQVWRAALLPPRQPESKP